jgi:hypothetical protein
MLSTDLVPFLVRAKKNTYAAIADDVEGIGHQRLLPYDELLE